MQHSGELKGIRILVADGHGILRDGLSAMLELEPAMTVVGTAGSGFEAVDAALRLKPQVVTMDLALPLLNGLDVTTQIICALPGTRVLILSACHTSEHIFRALRAGACGYVLKQSAGAELVQAILAIVAGKRYLSPAIDRDRLHGFYSKSTRLSPLERLSSRERQVLHLTVSGCSSAQTGQLLHLSQKTVDTYRSRLMAKLGVSSTIRLVHFAIANGVGPFMTV